MTLAAFLPFACLRRRGASAAGLAVFAVAMLVAVRAADAPERREWTVGGVAREALLHVPADAKTKPAPVVFVFHGHGGSMANSARTFAIHSLWPEAIVVYPQGLNTPGRLTDPEGKKPGWQHRAGDQGDRDLKFFDTVLAALRHEYQVDNRRVYSTGHSNGAGFTYLLWATRGDAFAAVAPSAAATTVQGMLKPKPVMHVAGRKDELVKFEWQEQTMIALRRLNQCGGGRAWAEECTIYDSRVGAPVVTMIHPGTHAFPRSAPPLIVKFFKEQRKP
ncbi:MAG: prolyl oligopeptidase family serine peptidase [Opitutaceae bacterium]|nr:prolyl oligopeptidase family serine peptidase [Opitutaceae bacterium]